MTVCGSGSTHECDVPGFEGCSEVLEQQSSVAFGWQQPLVQLPFASREMFSMGAPASTIRADFFEAVLTW